MSLAQELSAYRPGLIAALCMGFLFVIQTIVMSVSRRREGQDGGLPIEGGHARFLFRADRARQNTSEVIGVFVLALLLALIFGAEARAVNGGAILFTGARLLHMTSYYRNRPLRRRIFFALGNIGIAILLFSSLAALIRGG